MHTVLTTPYINNQVFLRLLRFNDKEFNRQTMKTVELFKYLL